MVNMFYESVVASAIFFAVTCCGSGLKVADTNRLNTLIRTTDSSDIHHQTSNIMENTADPEKAIRQSQSLCAGEQEYVHKRKQKVLKKLNSLGIDCTTNNVPHIALLGSGGGERADVAFMGTLYQMEKEGLLDTLLYLGGISGSTWCMSSVYNDSEWSSNMDRAMSRLFRPGVEVMKAVDWLCEQMNDEDFSLSDVWGALTSAKFIKEMDQRHLSDEASRNVSNPYPIYNAINKDCFTDGPTEGKWFEFSPHQAGFTELDFFIETSLLGSKFKGGELLEKKPEMDMVKLEGILGSALASGEVIKEYILNWLKEILHLGDANEEYQSVLAVLDAVIAVTRNPTVIPPVVFDLGTLQDIPEVTKANHILHLWLEAKSPEERKRLAEQWSLEMLAAVETWTQSQQEGGFIDIVKLVGKILQLIWRWEWGTTENFLYQQDAEEVKAMMDEFSNFQLPYSKEKTESQLQIVKANVKNNKETLLKEINKGILGSALASGEVIKEYILNWLKGILYEENEEYQREVAVLDGVIAVTRNPTVIPPVVFDLGTLQDIPEDRTVPTYLSSKERFHLMDAGLQMNVPYPPFLGDKRDIDLIIAPDYSTGDVFETLTLARDYAAEVKKPFPKIDDKILEERDWPKDCYVFEGKEEPTIVYMPLFNRRNCKDEAEVKAKMDEFSTFQRPYSKEKIESLLQIVKTNVKNNKETLLKEMKKAVQRREKK